MDQKLRIAVNTAASYSRLAVRMIVSLALAPYVLSRIGLVANGLYLEVIALVSLTTVLDAGLSAAVTRYVARESTLHDDQACREIWLTSLTAYIIPFAIVLLVFGAGAPWIASTLTHDATLRTTATRLLLIAAVMVALEFPANAYRGVLMGLQRHFAISLVEITAELFRAVAVVVLLKYWTQDVTWVLAATAAAIVGCNLGLCLVVHATCRWARFDRRAIRWERLREILGFSLATFVAQIGYTINQFMHRLLLGFLGGPSFVTRYAFASQFKEIPENSVMHFTNTMVPVAARYQATSNVAVLRQLMIRGSRYAVLMAGLLAAPIAAFAAPLLKTWLWRTPEMETLAPLMAGILGATIFELTRGATHAMLIGLARVRFLGFVNLSTILLDGIIAAVLFKTTNLGLYAMLIATVVGTLIRRAIISWHVCGVVDISKREYLWRCIIQPLAPAAVAFAAGRLIQVYYTPAGWIPVLACGTAAGLAGTIFAATITLTGQERSELLHPIKTAFQRLRRASPTSAPPD